MILGVLIEQKRALEDESAKLDEKHDHMLSNEGQEFGESKSGDARPKMDIQESVGQISQPHLGERFTLRPEGRTLEQVHLG